MDSLGMKPYEMGAVPAVLTSNARFDTEQIRIGAVDAFAEGNADLWDDNLAGTADCKQILARNVLGTALQICLLAGAKDTAAHEYMRMSAVIGFNVLKTLVHPVDAISAINHEDILV
jgi:hypothetical protein